MDIPFTIHFQVEQINIINEADILKITEYPINITLEHTISDIKHLIWRNSRDYSLKPLFLKVKYDGRPVNDNEKLCDVLQTPEAPELPVSQGFVLVIDYLLFNSPSIPNRDPVDELFDIMVEYEERDRENKTIKLRETLKCSIGVLKEYVAARAKRGKDCSNVDKNSINLVLASTNESCLDDELRLGEVLKLDVTPLGPVLFKVQRNDIPVDATQSRNRRFHIQIISTISALEDGNNLFELNFKTKLQDFKHQIIERIDYQSVRRTFFDQIKLYYATQLIENTSETNNKTISDILLLNDEIINQNNGIISMNLEISDSLSGNGGVLSREFLRDLRANNRFEFLPNRESSSRDLGAQSENNISPIESTKIIVEGGEEWNLAGETFEVIQSLGNSDNQHRGKLLVNQSNISSFDYEFSLQVPGENTEKKVLLNTSQCIVVDNGTYQPYVLLSPAGAARLNAVMRLADNQPLIQKVNILMYEDPQDITRINNRNQQVNANVGNEQNAPNPVRQGETIANIAFDLIRNNIRQWLGDITRSFFLIYILGLNSLFVAFWKEILAYGLIFGSLYLLFFNGNEVASWIETKFHLNVPDNRPRGLDERLLLKVTRVLHFTDTITTNIFSVLKNELIHTAIDRTRQYEYVFRNEFGQDGVWFYIVDTFTNTGKDILLMMLSLFPSFYNKIYEELETYRSSENEDLALEVRILREMTIDAVHTQRQGLNTSKFADDFIRHYTEHSYDEVTKELSESESYSASEDRYQALMEYYIRLHNLRTDLKKAMIDYETTISVDGAT